MIATGDVTVANIAKGFDAILSANKERVDDLLKDVAKFVRDEAKRTSAFADKTGNLRKSIGMRKSKFVDGGYIVKASGRNRTEGADGARGFHAYLVEFGHVKVLWGKRTGGRVKPYPFMRPALDRGISYAASKIRSMR
jgi:hypothetical protein